MVYKTLHAWNPSKKDALQSLWNASKTSWVTWKKHKTLLDPLVCAWNRQKRHWNPFLTSWYPLIRPWISWIPWIAPEMILRRSKHRNLSSNVFLDSSRNLLWSLFTNSSRYPSQKCVWNSENLVREKRFALGGLNWFKEVCRSFRWTSKECVLGSIRRFLRGTSRADFRWFEKFYIHIRGFHGHPGG